MAEVAPYLFDRAFEVTKSGSDASEATARAKLKEEWEKKMADACLKSFEEGQEVGKAEALQQLEAETLEQVTSLIGSAQKIMDAVEAECNQIRRNAIEIGVTAAKLLADELISRNPALSVEALFADALEYAGDAPHIAVTVNDACAERIQQIVTKVAAERAYTGKVVVLGDPETKTGDCSLQWADGGVAVDRERIESTLSGLVRKHLDRIAVPETGDAGTAADEPAQPVEAARETEGAPGDTP